MKKRFTFFLSFTFILSLFLPIFVFAAGTAYTDILGTTHFSDGSTAYTDILGTTHFSGGATSYTDILGTTHYSGGSSGSNGSLYTDILGNTHFNFNDGTNGTAYTDILGNTHVSDNKGNSGTAYTDILGTTHFSGDVFNSCPANSSYNSLSGKCSCSSGYVVSGSSCVKKTNEINVNSGNAYNNFRFFTPTDGSFTCQDGYQKDNDGVCVKIPAKTQQKIILPQIGTLCNGKYWGACSTGQTFYCPPVGNAQCILGNNSNNSVNTSNTKTATVSSSDIINKEKNLTKKIDKTFSKKQSGKILIQNGENSVMWYVNPKDNKRYLVSSGTDLLKVIQKTGKFVDAKQLTVIQKNPKKVAGTFIVDKTNWKYYYVNQKNNKFYEVAPKSGSGVYQYDDYNLGLQILKSISTNITNSDIRKIGVGEF